MQFTRETEFRQLFTEFTDSYLKEDHHHLQKYQKGRETANENYKAIKKAADAAEDITDSVLLKLLPHTDSKAHQDSGAWICIAPAITKDIRSWYEGAGWTKREAWPLVAKSIFEFIASVVNDPSSLEDQVSKFTSLPISKGFQAGVLSPILNALDPDFFLIKNKKSRLVTNYFTGLNFKAGLEDYPAANAAEKNLVAAIAPVMAEISGNSARPSDLYDMFCHWLYAVRKYPLIAGGKVKTENGEVVVSVPTDETEASNNEGTVLKDSTMRPSYVKQAQIAHIGVRMGFKIWVPRSDREAILSQIPKDKRNAFIERLPLNYNDVTINTIEQIDVIWMNGASMARAFEIEHTTSIYSGLLRMADLLALQPNMDIRLHIVAPSERREKVRQEILRPVFSLLQHHPLRTMCSFFSYESVDEMDRNLNLEDMKDSYLDKFAERFDEVVVEV